MLQLFICVHDYNVKLSNENLHGVERSGADGRQVEAAAVPVVLPKITASTVWSSSFCSHEKAAHDVF